MSLEELRKLLETLREFGVKSFEGSIDHGNLVKIQLLAEDPKLVKAAAEQHNDILKKIESVKSVMQLDDDNLIDRLFPVSEDTEEDPQRSAEENSQQQ